MKNISISFFSGILVTLGCTNETAFDASGVFEAREVIVSSMAAGEILVLDIEEGSEVKAGELVGTIDCEDLKLYHAQVTASKAALHDKRTSAQPDIDVLQRQIELQKAEVAALEAEHTVLIRERDRQKRLVAQDAAPTKTLDDINGQIDVLENKLEGARLRITVLKEQIRSAEQSAAIRNRGVLSDTATLQSQLDRIAHQIEDCNIINPIDGNILAKYVETHEVVKPGEALYKIGDLNDMTLRAYVTSDQLASIQPGQNVKVLVDDGSNDYRTYEGTITWIAEKAEFTPKTIQTKKERANLVYAVKISVKNDGFLRIGMYGEVDL
jgi:HlyD family secretion protein